MAQQTAVEQLVNYMKENFHLTDESLIKFEQAKQMEREQRKDDITDYFFKVTEFLLDPLFNLEHSKHGIACDKLADIRNEFIKKL